MNTNERSHRFNMMISVDEQEMLRTLAAARGVTASDVVRLLMRDAYKAYEAEQQAKKTKR